jgi:glycosyltransferase involved in cell wall biosynthesis
VKKPEVSLIISFYNDITWLKLVIAGLERQSYTNFEVIIADDGSRPEIVKEVEDISALTSFSITEVWHEDVGWRKNIILNKAIMAASGNYLIFIDGDCIPHRHFIREHYINRKKKIILAGRRVNLSSRISNLLTPVMVRKGKLEKGLLFSLFLHKLIFKDGSHAENGIYLGNTWLKKKLNKKKNKGILGSNFSIHKDDMMALNGFDERYILPAVGEDTDVNHRALFAGYEIHTLKHLAIQYHKYHEKLERSPKNNDILEMNIAVGKGYTKFGIIKEEL